VAKRLLRLGNGLYTEVDICTEDGAIETIANPGGAENAPEVLLVEDNAGDALLIGQALADCPTKVHLHIARDGEQALQILREPDYAPDLIILDLSIPKLSGYGVLESYPASKTTPVVVFSATENQSDVKRAFSLGAREFVHKPLDLDEYKTAVSGMVQKWTSNASTETLAW
jgi:CheY-like chemotaxis protein